MTLGLMPCCTNCPCRMENYDPEWYDNACEACPISDNLGGGPYPCGLTHKSFCANCEWKDDCTARKD